MSYARVDRISAGGGSAIRAWFYEAREKSLVLLNALFPSPEADLMAGILLGLDQGLSPNLQEAFQITGTSHIIAISGFNMTILAGLFTGIFTRLLGRQWGALAAVLGIALYTLFVGGEAAVVRAAVMGSLGVMGGMFGRRQTGLNSLGLAVFGMVLLDPNLPWDIGFQLSAAATLGLILFAQPMEQRTVAWLTRWLPEEKAQKIMGPLSEMFLFTLAAQVMTLPIIAYHFKAFSWIAFLANPLVLPPQPLVLILGGLALMAGWLLPGLGAVIAMSALPFVRYTIRVVSWLSGLEVGEMTLAGFHPLWLAIFYALLFFLALVPKEDKKALVKQIQLVNAGLFVLAGLTFFVWSRVLSQPDGRLHLTLLDGEGTCLIQPPDAGAVLIGGGASPSHLKQVLGERLPPGVSRVDWVIIASPARDDLNALLGGLSLESVGGLLWGIDPDANLTSQRLYSHFVNQKVPLTTLVEGQVLDLGRGIRLEVLVLEEQGAVLWLTWDRFSVLLPVGKAGDAWLKVPAPPDVILLPDDVSLDDFLLTKVNAWEPAAILLSLGQSDQPLAGEHALMQALHGYPLLSTLDHGWVRVSSNGVQVWVESER